RGRREPTSSTSDDADGERTRSGSGSERRHEVRTQRAAPSPTGRARRMRMNDERNQTLRKPRSPRRAAAARLTKQRRAAPDDATVVLHLCYKSGMARVRISTTVDGELLATARRTRSELADSALIDEALSAFLARNRAVEVAAA